MDSGSAAVTVTIQLVSMGGEPTTDSLRIAQRVVDQITAVGYSVDGCMYRASDVDVLHAHAEVTTRTGEQDARA